LDCCYSGAFPAGRIAKTDTAVHALERLQGRGRTVLTASDATQYSFEGNQLRGEADQSVFTRYLVAGLRDGSADLDGDGDITLDELYNYVHDRVVEELPQQRPKRQDNVEGRIIIARNINWSLPAYLRNTLCSPIATDRLSALDGLDHFYRIGNDVVRGCVRHEIQRLTNDDSRMVSTAAEERLRSILSQPPQRPVQQAPDVSKPEVDKVSEPRAARSAEKLTQRAGSSVPSAASVRLSDPSFLTAVPPIRPAIEMRPLPSTTRRRRRLNEFLWISWVLSRLKNSITALSNRAQAPGNRAQAPVGAASPAPAERRQRTVLLAVLPIMLTAIGVGLLLILIEQNPDVITPRSGEPASPAQQVTPNIDGITQLSDIAGPGCSQIPTSGEGSAAGMVDDPVATAASNNPLLTTLTAAVDAAELADTLNSAEAITVFAPINSAFEKLPPGTLEQLTTAPDVPQPTSMLTQILTTHVKGNRYDAEGLRSAGTVPNLQGSTLTLGGTAPNELTVSSGGVTANVVCANVPTANATVFLIDAVLMPAG
ncbi:MAG: fasciclin domain-containing protein, partial [Pseudonocardiaceae bacterium]